MSCLCYIRDTKKRVLLRWSAYARSFPVGWMKPVVFMSDVCISLSLQEVTGVLREKVLLMLTDFLYVFGLVVASGFVLFGLDDLIWDLAYMFNRRLHVKSEHVSWADIDTKPPKLIAIIIAAWHEDAVIESVIDHMYASVQYPRSLYHVFLGVYPNDQATIDAAERLAAKYDNVHVAINPTPGPTCKADNVNQAIDHIHEFEQARGWTFKSITIHDSEDVIHPYEFKLTSHLIDRYDALQFPVFPLQQKPRLSNFLSGLTSGTYADEFAENHYRTLPIRDKMSALVPSAGTGFVLSQKVLDYYKGEPLFPEDSLTEDYKLSVQLQHDGFHTHYVLEKVPRLVGDEKIVWDYVATRSLFPLTFRAAVRQKTRWIYGITMQSIHFSDIFAPNGLNLAGRYSTYKDLKAKVGNLLVLPGYVIFVYFILSLFLPLPVIYPAFTFSWWLCVFLTVLMIFRQIMRAVAIRNVYGWGSMVVACLLPPLMPVRLVWGNIINLCATLRAWRQLLFKPRKKGGKVAWNKTDHEFLSKSILYRYYRNVGDELLEKLIIDTSTLRAALRQSRKQNVPLGAILLDEGAVTEAQLMGAVAAVKHGVFVSQVEGFVHEAGMRRFDGALLRDLNVVPLINTETCLVMAQTNTTPEDAYARLQLDENEVHTVYATAAAVKAMIERGPQKSSLAYSKIVDRLSEDKMVWEQAVIALDTRKPAYDIMDYIGIMRIGQGGRS
jgi:bacteriophage N4 adsorption protein B